VCEHDPERPSRRAGQKEWARNLDHIVMKAMQKRADDRYQSPAELASEIRLVLEQQRVRKRAPFFSYQTRRAMRKLLVPAAAVTVLLLAAAGWSWKHASVAPARSSLAVLGFQDLSNNASNRWVGTALTEMVATQLASSERIRVVSNELVAQVKHDLNAGDAGSYSRDQLERLRRNLKVDYFVTGSYLGQTGSELRVYVRLQNARTGEIVAASTDNGAATALPTLSYEAVDDMLRNGGAGKAGLARSSNALQTFANPESARLYAEGLDKARHFDSRAAVELLAKAVAADPNNALAHAAYSAALNVLGYEQMAAQQAKLAYDASASLPRQERLSVAARYYMVRHDYVSAIATIRTLCELFPDNADYGLRLARAQIDAGKPRDALAAIAVLRSRLARNEVDARIELAEAKAVELQSDYKRMLQAAARASDAARSLNARAELAEAEQVRGDALYDLDRLDEALAAYRASEQIDRDLGNTFGLASIFIRQGRVFWKKGSYALNREYNENALALFQKIGNQSAVPPVLNNLALTMRQQGDIEGALKLLEHAIAINREYGDKKSLAATLNNAGNMLRRLNRPEEARRAYEECLAISLQLNDHNQIARSNLTLDRDNGDIVTAADRLQQALSIAGDSGSLRMVILQHLGEVKRNQGDAAGALKAFSESQQLARKYKAAQFEADTNLMLAEMAGEKGDRATADRLLAESRAYYTREKQKDTLWEAALADARVRLATGAVDGSDAQVEDAASGYHSIESAAGETEAYAVLAEIRLAQHKTRDAGEAIRRGRAAFLAAHNYEEKMAYRLQAARVEAALGHRAAAVRELRLMAADLESKGWSAAATRTRAALVEAERAAAARR
jgi:tetratricopeptide (TPR) repeat protein/TolB-like protein